MIQNLQKAFRQEGKLTTWHLCMEVAFTGESWRDVCAQAEQIGAVQPHLYRRLLGKLGDGQTLNSLIVMAFAEWEEAIDG